MPCADRPCLYNIETDPLEQHDLAETEPQMVTQMMRRLEELRAERLESPFSGGHHNAEACAALAANGAWSPWEK